MYITVEEVKKSGISSLEGVPDLVLEEKIKSLSRVIDEYCNTTFWPTQTEWHTDLKSCVRVLKKPLINVEEAKVLGETLEENTDYFVYPEKNIVELENISRFPKKKKALHLKYTYGYKEVPATVKEVLLELLKDSIESAKTIGKIKSEQWEDYQYTLADSQETRQAILLQLDRFVEDNEAETRNQNKVRAMLL